MRLPVLCIRLLLLGALWTHLPFETPGAAAGGNLQNRADLILYGGKIYTADSNNPWVEAVAILGNRISATGHSQEIRLLAGPRSRQIDLEGRVAIPGINDSHTHLGYSAPIGGFIPDDPANWMHGPETQQVLDGLAARAQTTEKNRWLRGQMGLKIRHSSLRREVLDKVAPDHPVILKASYGHGSMVNTRALRLLGVSDTAPDPKGGWYERAPGTRRITGLLDGSAQYEAWNAYFSSEPAAMVEELRKNAGDALRFGITTIQHMPSILGAKETVQAFKAAALPVRVRLIQWPFPSRPGEWNEISNQRISELTYVSGIKYVVDGTPLEQWAVMRKAYDGKPGWHGRLYYTEDDIRGFLNQAKTGSEQLMLHVVGDKTAEIVIRLMEQLASESTWKTRRVRFEHANGIAGEHVDAAKRLGIVLAQPRAGAAQIRSWQDAHLSVAHGSDGEPGNPWVDLMLATMNSGDEHALSREDALRMATSGSAYAEFAENQKGMLKPNMLADIAVLSQDVFTVAPDKLPQTTSLLTIVDGKVALDAGVLKISEL